MAISDDVPGLKINITVEGVALREHEDPHGTGTEDERTVTRYVEAGSWQVFAVSIELLPEFKYVGDCIGFEIYADGVLCDDPIIRASDASQTHVNEGVPLSTGKVNKYTFAELHAGESIPRVEQNGTLTLTQHPKAGAEDPVSPLPD